jgi:predicted ArsR family transcriptional regulator
MAEEVGLEYGKAMAETLEPSSTHRSFQGALHAIADALSAHGFAARAEHAEEDEELRIVAEHCPFGDAVVEHPVICAVDRGIVKGMLAHMIGSTPGADTASSLAQGDNVCVTHVSL